MSHWATKYIGLPYVLGGVDRSGLDCWGLVKLFYLEERGIVLPDLPGISVDEILSISREILAQCKLGWVEVASPQDGDVVTMSLKQAPHHVGIWAQADGGKVIHSWMGGSVVADTFRQLKFRGIRTIKFLMYKNHGYHR